MFRNEQKLGNRLLYRRKQPVAIGVVIVTRIVFAYDEYYAFWSVTLVGPDHSLSESLNKIHFWFVFTDADRAASIAMFGGGQHLSSLHSSSDNCSDNSNTSNFYSDSFAQQQHRHQTDENGGLLFSSAYPVPIAPEPQPHIRLQSPPHRLNHRNRNLHHNRQYESGTWSPVYTYIYTIHLLCIVYAYMM